MASFVGVDGCKGGWFAVWDDGSGVKGRIYRSVTDIWEEHKDATRILMDIPIGLKALEDRNVEQKIRSLLGLRRNSVFPVPCAAAAYASDYAQASALNRLNLGKGLSKQAWFITPLIRDVDKFLKRTSSARQVLGECHPELAFATFNMGPLSQSKKTAEGQFQRISIIRDRMTELDKFLEACRMNFRRSELQVDDCLDALILLLTAKNARRLDEALEEGVGGIPIGMWVPDISGYY